MKHAHVGFSWKRIKHINMNRFYFAFYVVNSTYLYIIRKKNARISKFFFRNDFLNVVWKICCWKNIYMIVHHYIYFLIWRKIVNNKQRSLEMLKHLCRLTFLTRIWLFNCCPTVYVKTIKRAKHINFFW